MKKQNDQQSSGTTSESPILKDAAATTSRQDHRVTGEGSASSDGAHELIRARAYRLFELRARQPGHALDDWLQAEHEVLRPSQPPQDRGIACSC
jgi:hypothetical protein